MSDLTEKVCYLIKCEVEEAYYDNQHQVHFMHPTYYFTGKEYTLYKKKYFGLSKYPTNAKKFYALDIANHWKEKLLNAKFTYGRVINAKIRNLEVTTPSKEGIVETVKGTPVYGGSGM